jgi:hypothetical protein
MFNLFLLLSKPSLSLGKLFHKSMCIFLAKFDEHWCTFLQKSPYVNMYALEFDWT